MNSKALPLFFMHLCIWMYHLFSMLEDTKVILVIRIYRFREVLGIEIFDIHE